MISEADAREAARHLASARERLSKLDEEDFEFKSIARDMDNHAWRLACFAVDELARREAERAERAKPITPEWLESLEDWRRTGEYISTRIKGNDVWYYIEDSCVGFGGLRQGHITTRGQLLYLLAALKGGET